MEIVAQRNEIVDCLEMDRLRELEEDESIEVHMGEFAAVRPPEGEKKTKKKKKEKEKKKKKKDKVHDDDKVSISPICGDCSSKLDCFTIENNFLTKVNGSSFLVQFPYNLFIEIDFRTSTQARTGVQHQNRRRKRDPWAVAEKKIWRKR